MRIESFEAGFYKEQFQYKSFMPKLINLPWTWDTPEVHSLLSEANRWLGELNAFGKILPDVDLYIKMHVLKEANASSRIEGTQTNMETAALPEEAVEPERRDDWKEVQNYVAAVNHTVARLGELPLSNRLLRDGHALLMAGVRGEHKTPGEFRTSQNWIGGSSLNDAIFIPPHPNDVPELMSDLELFWNNDRIHVPHLICIALSHYQFETIHPFLDGNGRIGRLLIILYLMSNGLLAKPCLYISDFFEKHRAAYYDALTAVRTRNDLLHWVKFFLSAMISTASRAVDTFRAIMDLKEELYKRTLTLGRRSHNAARLLTHLYQNPTQRAQRMAEALDLTPPTINTLLQNFVRLEILVEVTGYQRNRLFYFKPYMDLFLR